MDGMYVHTPEPFAKTRIFCEIPFPSTPDDMAEKVYKLVLVDDHTLLADGLRTLLDGEPDLEVVAHFDNGLAAVERGPDLAPDLVLMDLDMPIMNGLEATRLLKEKRPDLPIIILSMHAEKAIVQKAMQEGARGYLLKNSSQDELLHGIRAVLRGNRFYSSLLTESLLDPERVRVQPETSVKLLATLSERELEVLRLLAEGLSSKEIGEQLFLSPQTIDSHRKTLLRKLDAKNVAGLVRIAFREGLID
ncbi:MAG: DNA-binding response regulator [Bacteroidetes bacterium]|nr:MAG: DNA-binding response regulator [Bacteroidota bacterium]